MSLEYGEEIDASISYFIFIFQYIAQTVDMYQWPVTSKYHQVKSLNK